ncbi:YceD family protein [Skermania piniformis]|uniref:DUF177 domain-containing protein n=1 Tax=Skermania pinensis TaxID=39122 RepID=A0ABX8SAH6_9ACTN|nr:DUF177 domain-containing protein [Skermania piniformis]QXQ12721.1 DUF177 domain-containing protein [Skermania piniformis]
MPGSAPPRRPADGDFVVDTRSLGRRAGAFREVRRTVHLPNRIGLDLVAIPAGAPLQLELQLQAVSEGVLVTGTVAGPQAGECARCLEPFAADLEVPLTELYAYPDSVTEQTTEDGEIYRVVDEHIDLEPAIVDAVGLALPLQPLCAPDCPGLCAECGTRLAIAGPDHRHETIDPRWAGLAAKFGASDGADPGGDAAAGDRS